MKSFFGFSFAVFLKIIIPGIIGVLAFLPIIASIGIKLGINASSFENIFLSPQIIVIGFVFFIGLIVNFLDYYIYRVFEGLIFWPKGLRKKITARLNKKIERKNIEFNKIEEDIEKKLLKAWLMKFPLKKKRTSTETEALLPTRLGNIIYSYEDYPKSRYGIRSIFFWDRLWLAIDKETRNEVDKIWSEADCIIYISFIFLFSSIIYLPIFLIDLLNIPTLIFGSFGKPVSSLCIGNIPLTPWFFLGAGLVFLILSRLFYILSLPLHVRNGSLFQALFDLHRDKLEKVTDIKDDEAQKWEKSWCYLKYGLKFCNKCSNYYPITSEECPHCK